jgi:hypothetical protein
MAESYNQGSQAGTPVPPILFLFLFSAWLYKVVMPVVKAIFRPMTANGWLFS